MRSIFAAALAATLVVMPALAAETSNAGALSAGKPAGVKQAQIGTDTIIPLIAAAGLVAGLAIVASQHSDTAQSVAVSTATTS